jgi:hypothetical protein
VVTATRRFGGTVAQYLGDGTLVYFGYPHALEDAAQRAVWTGLAVIEGMVHLNERLKRQYGLQVAVRVGIHTGHVVMTELIGDGKRDPAPVGETMHLAARLSSTASIDSVLVSDETHRLVSGFFEFAPLGPMRLRGIGRTVDAYRVLRSSAVRSRFEAATARGLSPFVGRLAESRALDACWEQAASGTGQLALVTGEAGIGKSRLVHELGRRLDLGPDRWLLAASAPHRSDSAFGPILELVELILGFAAERDPDARRRRLDETLGAVGGDAPGAAPLIARLLGLPADEDTATSLAPEAERRRLVSALVGLLLYSARRRPTVLVIEDVHWADPSSLELLDEVVRALDRAPVLLVLSTRPGFAHEWPRACDVVVSLDRLTADEVRVLARAVTRGAELPVDVEYQLVVTTDGIPLFVEEFARTALETHTRAATGARGGPSHATPMPSTLRDLLMARLDGLGETKEIAQAAAVIGREFDGELLAAVSGSTPAALASHLHRLTASDLVHERQEGPTGRYLFKHALIRDAAYDALLRRQRRELHERAGRALERGRHPRRRNGGRHAGRPTRRGRAAHPTTPPELIAYHFTEAGCVADALGWWERAAQRAVQSYAGEEAIRHLTRALDLVAELPESAATLEREADLRVALCSVVFLTKGTGAPEVGEVLTRARAVCERAGRHSDLHYVLYMLAGFHNLRAEYGAGRRVARDALLLAETPRTWSGAFPPEMARAAHLGTLAASLLFSGESAACLDAARAAMQTPLDVEGFVLQVGMAHPVVVAHSEAAMALWMLGFPDQALDTVQRGAALLRGHDAPQSWSLCFARGFATEVRLHRREAEAALAEADALIALARARGMQYWLDTGCLLRAAALLLAEQGAAAVAELEEAFARAQGSQTRISTSRWLGVLGSAYATVGRLDEALGWIRAARAFAEEHGERAWYPELCRLEGSLLLERDASARDAAEACFREALAGARAQGGKAWELRAATSLARLLRGTGRHGEVREALAHLFATFTEGHATPDLIDARALLDATAG